MSTPLSVECSVHFQRGGPGRRKTMTAGPKPEGPPLPAGRVPRVARLMALAIRFDGLVRSGAVRDYAELARLGHVTRARVTQVMSLLLLAPDVQEAVLFLPRTESGRDPLILRDLLPLAAVPDWHKQRKLWQELRGV